MIRRKDVFILVLFMALGITSTAFAKKHDLEYWHTESIAYKINKDWKITFGEEGYLNDTASHPYYEEADLGFVYSGVGKWLDLSLNYKYALVESNNRWLREERPHLNATFKCVLKGFSITDRNRIEFRIIRNAEDIWRYRNLLTVKFPWKFTAKEIQPYFADEIIVNCDKKQLNENRIYVGFIFKINKNLGADIYYMRRRIKTTTISNSDIMGTRLTYSF